MKFAKHVCLAIIFSVLAGCGDSDLQNQLAEAQAKNGQLQSKVKALEKEIAELKRSPSAILAGAEGAYSKENWTTARDAAKKLIASYPSSPEASRAQEILDGANSKIEMAAAAAEKEKALEKQRLALALSKMSVKTDPVEKTTFYTDKTTPKYTNYNSFHAYFGSKAGQSWMRLRVQYTADEWLFIKSFTVVADGRRYDFNPASFSRDNDTDIWEWYDEPANSTDIEMLRAVASSKSATLRLNGMHYYKDRQITSAEKLAIRNVLDAFKVVNGKAR